MSIVGLLAIIYLLLPVTDTLYEKGLIHHHETVVDGVEQKNKH